MTRTYREGIPELESPCGTPELEAVGWCVCSPVGGDAELLGYRCVVVWTKYAIEAKRLGGRKLRVLDLDMVEVRRLKGAA